MERKQQQHPTFLVVIAASAGGPQALTCLLSRIPPDLPVSFVVVQHLAPYRSSYLSHILASKTCLPIKQARALERILPGWVYLAPPDHHIIIYRPGYLALSQSPRVHFVRPSADVLFSSAALAYTDRVVSIILSGTGQDGSAGTVEVKKKGGYTIAQDPASAQYPGMPLAAVKTGMVDLIAPLDQIYVHLMQKIIGGAP